MRVLAVTGTDTGVGKTVVAAAAVALAAEAGLRVAYLKPAQTGVQPGEPGDADDVRRLAGVADVHELVRLPDPLAPAAAARLSGRVVPSVAEVAAYVRDVLADRDLVVVEGAGGLLVHLDEDGGTLAALAGLLAAPVLVVARAGLGTLNATALTCEALRRRALRCPGVVVGSWPAHPDLAARCNLGDLPAYAGAPLLGHLPEGAGALSRAELVAVAAERLGAGLAPLVGPVAAGGAAARAAAEGGEPT